MCSVLCSSDPMTMKPKTINFTEIMTKKIKYELWCLKMRYGLEWLTLYHLSINALHIFDNDTKNTHIVCECKGNIKCSELLVRTIVCLARFLCLALHALLIEIFMAQQFVKQHQHQRHLWLANKSDFKKSDYCNKPDAKPSQYLIRNWRVFSSSHF